jgi:ribose transport system permease protein
MSQGAETRVADPSLGAGDSGRPARGRSRSDRIIALSGIQRFGAVYVLAGIIILFSVWKPETFPTWTTARSILDSNAIVILVALSLVVPLAAGVFDLSIGNVMALISVAVAWLVVEQGLPIGLAIVVSLLLALAVGLINAWFVVVVGIDSFIATLGTGAVLQALNLLLSGNEPVTDVHLSTGLGKLIQADIADIQVPVFVALIVAIGLWWLLERTATGRRIYATGFNQEASRLAGVRTGRMHLVGLVMSALLAGLAGVLVTGQVGSGSPEVGPPYLLEAFAVAFLGATQIRNGRFNAAGTVLAGLVLGTGNSGLTLVGAPSWALSLYTGVVLLVALTLTRIEVRQLVSGGQDP